MNQKYDYMQLLGGFTPKEFKIFGMLASTDEKYVAQRVYNAIKHNVAGASHLFLKTGESFMQWFTECNPANQYFSFLDTEIISQIRRNKEWVKAYDENNLSIDNAVNYLIASWKNETKSLKANMSKLNMIYLRYIRFLNSRAGQDFVYGTSIELLTSNDIDEMNAFYLDKPYWEQLSYQEEQLMKLKKHCILKLSENALQMSEIKALWDATFNMKDRKFSIAAATELVRQDGIDETEVSKSSVYRHLKRLRVSLLEEILNNLDGYFNEDIIYEINGKIVNVRSALEMYLKEAKQDWTVEQLSMQKDPNVVIVNEMTDFCKRNHLTYTTDTNSPSILMAIKGDSTGVEHRHFCFYIYKNGGFKDFHCGRTGFYTELVGNPYIRNKLLKQHSIEY